MEPHDLISFVRRGGKAQCNVPLLPPDCSVPGSKRPYHMQSLVPEPEWWGLNFCYFSPSLWYSGTTENDLKYPEIKRSESSPEEEERFGARYHSQ